MATPRTDMAREVYTHVFAYPSVLRIDGDVNREVNRKVNLSWCESREPMRLTATPAMYCKQSSLSPSQAPVKRERIN